MITENDADYCLDCSGDVCEGDIISFFKEVWIANKLCGVIKLYGRVLSEIYNKNGRHDFYITLKNGAVIDIRGRDFYKYEIKRRPWHNEHARMEVLREKHNRGAKIRRRINEKLNRKDSEIRDGGTGVIQRRRAS